MKEEKKEKSMLVREGVSKEARCVNMNLLIKKNEKKRRKRSRRRGRRRREDEDDLGRVRLEDNE